MLDAKKLLDCAGKNIAEILNQVDPAQIEEIATALAEAKRVFTRRMGPRGKHHSHSWNGYVPDWKGCLLCRR